MGRRCNTSSEANSLISTSPAMKPPTWAKTLRPLLDFAEAPEPAEQLEGDPIAQHHPRRQRGRRDVDRQDDEGVDADLSGTSKR